MKVFSIRWGRLFLLSVAVTLSSTMVAKVIEIKSEEKLNRIMRKNILSVVLFYNEDRQTRHDRYMREQLRSLRQDFKALSVSPRYQDADVVFVTANIARGDLQALWQELGAQEVPVAVLYRDGSVVSDKNNNVAMLPGLFRQGDLKKFINDNLNKDIDDILEIKSERRRARLEEDRLRARYYGSYYGPWVGLYLRWPEP